MGNIAKAVSRDLYRKTRSIADRMIADLPDEAQADAVGAALFGIQQERSVAALALGESVLARWPENETLRSVVDELGSVYYGDCLLTS